MPDNGPAATRWRPRTSATVVGGGPAGLMAAEVMARAGLEVTVYEHMASVGRKLLLAGRGGLNITHSEPLVDFVARYGPDPSRIESALGAFGPAELRAWFADLGEPTFVGSSGRVFPASFRATPLLRAWLRRLAELGVEIRVRHRWQGFVDDGAPAASRFLTPDGRIEVVHADVTLLALGGASWPRVGSTGTWTEPMAEAGIGVTPLQPHNCGVRVRWTDRFVERFAGHPVKNIAISVNGTAVRGDCVVTADGLEGGPVYALSGLLRGALEEGRGAFLRIDLNPDLTEAQLAERLLKRRPKDSASTWLRKAGFSPSHAALLREALGRHLPTEAAELASVAKALPVRVDALMPIARAISTAGGVRFDELDERYMVRSLPGVFVAGEMLDWEAPTGGYLLQGCFSTAVVAAHGAIAWTQRRTG